MYATQKDSAQSITSFLCFSLVELSQFMKGSAAPPGRVLFYECPVCHFVLFLNADGTSAGSFELYLKSGKQLCS